MSEYQSSPAPPRPAAPPPPPPPREAQRRPIRVDPMPDTRYGLAIFGAPPATSGPSAGALVTGIGAVLVAALVACFGLADAASNDGAQDGWGAMVGGAFAVLAGFLGAAGIGLGVAGLRQTSPARQPADGAVRGRGMAIAGLVCGALGIVVTVCSIGLAVVAALA